eukprot:c22685_g1_i1 orf=62-961(+)
MAGYLFSDMGSPPSYEDPLLNPAAAQDWELLSISTMSASTLLAHGHGLGFGLPPRSTPAGLHTSRTENDGVLRKDADSDADERFIFRSSNGSSLPLDVSQIAVICTSSTSAVEPFTEGWKPQFRIAGAPLQENYYTPDPFAPAASNTGSSLEPFLDMEQSFLKEPSIVVDNEAFTPPHVDKKQGFFSAENTGKHVKDVEALQQQENIDEHLAAPDEVMKTTSVASELADSGKASCTRKTRSTQSKRLRQKRQGFFYGKSYFVWSVALTTALLGVFWITYCSQTDHDELLQELSSGDEVG